MTRTLGTLFGGMFAVWTVAVVTAMALAGERAAVYCTAAFLICLLPALATLAWSIQTMKHKPTQAFAVMTGGTGVRVAFVLGASLILNQTVPYFEPLSFWGWIAGFYLLALCLETFLVRRLNPAGSI